MTEINLDEATTIEGGNVWSDIGTGIVCGLMYATLEGAALDLAMGAVSGEGCFMKAVGYFR